MSKHFLKCKMNSRKISLCLVSGKIPRLLHPSHYFWYNVWILKMLSHAPIQPYIHFSQETCWIIPVHFSIVGRQTNTHNPDSDILEQFLEHLKSIVFVFYIPYCHLNPSIKRCLKTQLHCTPKRIKTIYSSKNISYFAASSLSVPGF